MHPLAQLGPLAQAVGAGTLDSIENVAINITRLVPGLASLARHRHRSSLDVPLSDQTWVVTGGNAGIGLSTARAAVERGATVVIACRSKERAAVAIEELSTVEPLPGCTRGRAEYAHLDLASLASARRFAKSFNKQGRKLDVLIANAGLMSPPKRLESADGLEMQFQVNFLGHWLIAHELLAEQRRRRAKAARRSSAGASSSGGPPSTRLVMMSSLTHHAGSIKWDDKQSAASYSPFTSYALSKLCNTIAAAEFQRRFDRADAARYGRDTALAIHPGIVQTNLALGFFRQIPGVEPVLGRLYPLLLRTPESSADSMLLAALAPADKVAGGYMHNDRISRPNKFAESPKRGAELWDYAVALTGLATDESLA